MMNHFADRLLHAIQKTRAPVCVGIDPVLDRIPDELLQEHGVHLDSTGQPLKGTSLDSVGKAFKVFGREVIHLIADLVPACKLNIAFFEPYFDVGVRTYFELIREARQAGLLVIGDIKRSDIDHSAAQYALAHLGSSSTFFADASSFAEPDAVTINAYLGSDGIAPFVDVAKKEGRGVFALVQTSNRSAEQLQGLKLSDGRRVVRALADYVNEWSSAAGMIGESGFSLLGAVVAPQDRPGTMELRKAMPACIFLVPGFGFQGRSAEDVAACFRNDGTGAIVNASRSIIHAYRDSKYRDQYGNDWRRCIVAACKDFADAFRFISSR
ncbi:MAG: orotidine-5'-phosphate decarboxylase [Planctomycetota bacterium]